MGQVNGADFQRFAESINRGIPTQTSTIAEKKNAIDGKKRILYHPDCPPDAKVELRKEIAMLEAEIKKMQQNEKEEKHQQCINTSVFPKRNIG